MRIAMFLVATLVLACSAKSLQARQLLTIVCNTENELTTFLDANHEGGYEAGMIAYKATSCRLQSIDMHNLGAVRVVYESIELYRGRMFEVWTAELTGVGWAMLSKPSTKPTIREV